MSGVVWTDAEREALEAIQFGSYQAADTARTALARLVAAREAQAAAKALREAADSFVERLGPIGHPWAADLRADADRIEQGESS